MSNASIAPRYLAICASCSSLVLLSMLFGCATTRGEQAATSSPLAAPEGHVPPVNLAALIERDGLESEGDPETFNSGARWLEGHFWAQLDGKGSPELLVYVWEYAGEGAWSWMVYAYDVSDPKNPTRLGPVDAKEPLYPGDIHGGGYMDPGYLRVLDMDGDGRDEVLDVGHTDSVAASEIKLWSWNAGTHRFEDRIWGGHPGTSYFPVDADGDSKLEILALAGNDSGPVRSTTLVFKDGYWRAGEQVSDEVVARLLLSELERGMERAHIALPLLFDELARRGIAIEDRARVQRALEKLHANAAESSSSAYEILDAMGRCGHPEAAEFLRPIAKQSDDVSAQIVASASLMSVGTREDRRVILDEFVRGLDAYASKRTEDLWFADSLLVKTLDQGEGAVLEQFMAWYASAGIEARVRVLERLVMSHGALATPFVAALNAARDDREVAALAAFIANASRSYFADHKMWLDALPAKSIERLYTHPDPRIRVHGMELLARESSGLEKAQLVDFLLQESSTEVAIAILEALSDDPPDEVSAEGLKQYALVLSRLEDGAVRYQAHRAMARSKSDALRSLGIASVRSLDELEAYTYGHGATFTAAERVRLTSFLLSAFDRAEGPRARQRVFKLMGVCGDETLGPILVREFEVEREDYVRAAIVEALGALRYAPAITSLELYLTSETVDSYYRTDIVRVIAQIGTPEARKALESILSPPAQWSKDGEYLQRVVLRGLAGITPADDFAAMIARRQKSWRADLDLYCGVAIRELGIWSEYAPEAAFAEIEALVEEAACADVAPGELTEIFDHWRRHPHARQLNVLKRWSQHPLSRDVRVDAIQSARYIARDLGE